MVEWTSWGFVLFLKQQKNRTEVYTREGWQCIRVMMICVCVHVCAWKRPCYRVFISVVSIYLSCVCVCVCYECRFYPILSEPSS